MWISQFLLLSTFIALNFADCDITESSKKCQILNSISNNEPSIFVIHADGRLGNHLMAFGIVLALGKHLNIRPYVEGETARYLKKYFLAENIPVFEDTFCNHEDLKPTWFDGDLDYLVETKEFHTGKLILLWPFGYKVRNSKL